MAPREWEPTFNVAIAADNYGGDRKSTRLNPSHLVISYAAFCLTKNNPTAPSPREEPPYERPDLAACPLPPPSPPVGPRTAPYAPQLALLLVAAPVAAICCSQLT